MLIRVIFSIILLLSFHQAAFAASTAPAAFIQDTFAELKESIQRGDIHAGMSDAEILRYLEKELGSRMDFQQFARGVMGKYARQASKIQLAFFAESLKAQMLRTYSKGLKHVERFDRIEVTGTTLNKNKNSARVATKLLPSGGESFQVTYQLRFKPRGWRITNLIAEGINLGLVYRSQFADLFNAQGRDMEATLKRWDQQIRQPLPANSDSPIAD